MPGKRVAAMLPRVDIGEQILEVMGWVPEFLESLTALSGGAARMADLNVTVAACLTGQALNIGYGPVSSPGVAALERRRLGHAGRTYLRAAGYTAANPHLIAQQAGIGFARALGGGDGRRDRRHAVRRPRPFANGQTQPEVFRAETRDDVPEHDQ